ISSTRANPCAIPSGSVQPVQFAQLRKPEYKHHVHRLLEWRVRSVRGVSGLCTAGYRQQQPYHWRDQQHERQLESAGNPVRAEAVVLTNIRLGSKRPFGAKLSKVLAAKGRRM